MEVIPRVLNFYLLLDSFRHLLWTFSSQVVYFHSWLPVAAVKSLGTDVWQCVSRIPIQFGISILYHDFFFYLSWSEVCFKDNYVCIIPSNVMTSVKGHLLKD